MTQRHELKELPLKVENIYQKTINFKHRINNLKAKIKNFNRVELKGFKSYDVNFNYFTKLGTQ